ncbi:MAG: sulfatase [Saprospiraceae bacterium]
MRKIIICFFLFISFAGICQSTVKSKVQSSSLPFRPNILWLVTEDLSPVIPPFGDSTIVTPVLSRLAKEGVRYTHVFSPSGVCAPSRAAIALGMYPSRVGAMHMRNGFWAAGRPSASVAEAQRKSFPPDIPYYEAVPPPDARMHSEYLRMQGYYCSNRFKQDYQFVAPVTAWDDCSPTAHWHGRQAGQPFFSIFNFEVTHESQIWGKAKDSMWVAADAVVKVPPYLPSTPVALNDIRRMYSNVKEMDYQIGKMIDQLEKEGLLDSTIIFWYADHGGPLPRQKRLCYDSGLRAPLIIRYPNKWRAGQIDSQLISFVDFLPTLMSMSNTKPTELTDGRSFAGAYESKTKRKYIHGGGDRFDEQYDMIRAVRDQRYKYLRNFEPTKGYYLPVAYREQMPIMQELLRLHKSHQLNEYQEQWFRSSKPKEELFDTYTDPYELHNIADDVKYNSKLIELRNECDRWMNEIDDKGKMKEIDYLHSIWHGDNKPVTADPVILRHSNSINMSSATPGASIGYKITHNNSEQSVWSIYQKPVPLLPGDKLKVIAHRIGYEPSRILEF